jgi:hypothetical protein
VKRDVRRGDSESLKKCEECGDVIDVLPTSGTALLQNSKTQKFSVVGLHLVRCYYEGHAYYVTDLTRQVYDPFEPGEIEEE